MIIVNPIYNINYHHGLTVQWLMISHNNLVTMAMILNSSYGVSSNLTDTVHTYLNFSQLAILLKNVFTLF